MGPYGDDGELFIFLCIINRYYNIFNLKYIFYVYIMEVVYTVLFFIFH